LAQTISGVCAPEGSQAEVDLSYAVMCECPSAVSIALIRPPYR
jgi:hypothetical protein